ncbi:unnamed protein product [Caenorhabditis brenneri]
MVFSLITAIPMFLFFMTTTFSYAWTASRGKVVPYEPFGLFVSFVGLTSPNIVDSYTTVRFLVGMVQSAFLCNVFLILHVNFGDWVDIRYARYCSTLFGIYSFLRLTYFKTMLIPKRPLKLNWKSIIAISMFFFSTGYYMYPYTPFLNLFYHVYVYLLCIETSIWYYTKEFRLYCKYPKKELTWFHKAYYITVHRS